MADKFFLFYINFVGILKFLPFFLYEGVKGIYRYAYGIISICPFKIVKETKPEEQKDPNQLYPAMSLLSEQISLQYDFEKRPEAEVLKLYKEVTNKLENWSFFLDSAKDWDLTHRNNTFVTLKIPSKVKELFPKVEKSKYIPSLFPDSKILTKETLPKF